MIRISLLVCLVFCFVQCTNNPSSNDEAEQARLEAEKAKAEADSLKKLLEANNNADKGSLSDSGNTGLPAEQVKEVGKLNPIDEGRSDASFIEFRTNLLAAIERKDLDYVLSQCHEDVMVSFGSEGGVADFRSMWFDGDPEDSEFWQTMKKILDLGGTWFSEDPVTFAAPYVFSTFPDEF